jgi:DNA-directed RNA polymerase subunit M/transcription elongation factor TFIIS
MQATYPKATRLMDFTFNCPNCNQELEVDIAAVGSAVECPACNKKMKVPAPEVSQLRVAPHGAPASSHDFNREEKHFVVPVHEGPAEALITKSAPTLEVASKDPDKKIRIKTFRRVDTMTVAKDHFDEVVSEFLQKVGQEYIISITPMTYTYKDLATEHYVTDYGVMVVFRG